MLSKQCDTFVHQLIEQVTARAARIVIEHRLICQIVRGRGARVPAERGRLPFAAINEQVAIADAGKNCKRSLPSRSCAVAKSAVASSVEIWPR